MDLFENLQNYSKYNYQVEDVNELIEQEAFFEMANISKNKTKLRYDIWLDSVGSSRKNKHNLPRVKIIIDNNMIPISISKNPEFLVDISKYKKIKGIKPVFDFIAKFEDVLLMHWNEEIDDIDLLGIIFDTLKGLPKDDAIRKYVFNEED